MNPASLPELQTFPKRRSSQSLWTILGGIVLVLLTFIAYAPIHDGDFLWDDEFLVLKNPMIRSPVLAVEIFNHFLFTDSRGEFYRPIQNLSYIFDYWRAGFDAPAFHATSLGLHGLNALLLFMLSRRLLRQLSHLESSAVTAVAFCLAAFWSLHPVHSAAVAYISGRADSLALAGVLGAWLCWENARGARRSWRQSAGYVGAAILALIACCSKEIATAALGLFLLYVWLFRTDLRQGLKIRHTLGILVVFAAYLILRSLPEPNIAPAVANIPSESGRPELFFRAMGDYFRLIVYPEKLFMERQVSSHTGLFTDPVKNDALFPFLGWIGGVALAVVFSSLFWRKQGRRLRGFGALWFSVMILPVSNLFPLNATIAEHWLYFPLIGVCFWATGCWFGSNKPVKTALQILFPIILLAIGGRTWVRAVDWRDPVTFYVATVRAGGDSVRVRMNLAAEYQKRGHLEESECILRSVVQVMPNLLLAKLALARNLNIQGRASEATALLPQTAANESSGTTEKVALLETLARSDKPLEATAIAREAYERSPHSWQLAKTLAGMYLAQGNSTAALVLVRGFAARNWWHAESHNQLGELFVAQEQSAQAVDCYVAAACLDVRDPEPLSQAALLLAQDGRYKEALALQEKALRRSDSERQQEIHVLIQRLATKNLPTR
ncbi:MAG TPA: hypothetical protein VF585_02970 [Chthoniobacterales bacterium]